MEEKMDRITENRMFKKLILILALTILATSFSFGKELKTIQEKTFSVKDWENLYVNADGADIIVASWDKQEVYVKVLGNHKAEEQIKLKIEKENDAVVVIAKEKKFHSFFNWFGNNISLRIEVMVPRKYNADLETSGGNLKLSDLTGGFKLNTSGGNISLNGNNGKLNAETSGGNIKLVNHKGKMDISTSGGNIDCRSVTGDLKAETSGGNVDIELTDGKLYTETSGGDISISYTGMNKGLEASTSGGSIRVKLPADFKAKAHLETGGGTVRNHFSNVKDSKVSQSEIDCELNGGGNILKLETSGGDVIVDQK
jgi:DUF4097 and DUF4098 domain-containing protein YvlB